MQLIKSPGSSIQFRLDLCRKAGFPGLVWDCCHQRSVDFFYVNRSSCLWNSFQHIGQIRLLDALHPDGHSASLGGFRAHFGGGSIEDQLALVNDDHAVQIARLLPGYALTR